MEFTFGLAVAYTVPALKAALTLPPFKQESLRLC